MSHLNHNKTTSPLAPPILNVLKKFSMKRRKILYTIDVHLAF